MRKIMLCEGNFGWDFEICEVRKNGKSVLIQTDWDYPGAASLFGWTPKRRKGCTHDGTDGTVDCKACGKSTSDFLSEAHDYLSSHTGKVILSDYFGE